MNDIQKKMLDAFFSTEIQNVLQAINKIAGHKLEDKYIQSFRKFHKYITNPQPNFITEWRTNPKEEKWYHSFVNGILGNVQNSYSCVHYHFERLSVIEKETLDSIEQYNYQEILGDSTIALGDTKRIDFEYQAFVLAYRRCLDLLARAVSARFKNDFHSFRRLNKFLISFTGNEIADNIIVTQEKYSPLFEFVMSDGNRKSVRDKIAHYEYVQAWTLNLNKNGFMLVGGGEGMNLTKSDNEPKYLSELLEQKLNNLNNCITDIIDNLIEK